MKQTQQPQQNYYSTNTKVQNHPNNASSANAMADLGFSTLINDTNTLLFRLTTSKAIFFTNLTIKVYLNMVSLEYKPFIGSWEHRETYNAMDIGDIYINKGRKRAVIGAHRINSNDSLFEIKGLFHFEAEDLKDALDELIGYRFNNATLIQTVRYP